MPNGNLDYTAADDILELVTADGTRTSFPRFIRPISIEAVGGRIGLVICRTCGVTLQTNPEIDTIRIHDQWHHELDDALRYVPLLGS